MPRKYSRWATCSAQVVVNEDRPRKVKFEGRELLPFPRLFWDSQNSCWEVGFWEKAIMFLPLPAFWPCQWRIQGQELRNITLCLCIFTASLSWAKGRMCFHKFAYCRLSCFILDLYLFLDLHWLAELDTEFALMRLSDDLVYLGGGWVMENELLGQRK